MKQRNQSMPSSTLELPENLGARCSLLYVWDEEYTLRALEGYLQFMELKANFEDWDCEQLAPSGVIDLVWKEHLLYNKQYSEACLKYCDNVIGYDPDIALSGDDNLQAQRIKTTKIALKALYGRGYDQDVWNFEGSDLQKKGKVTFSSQSGDLDSTADSTSIKKGAVLESTSSLSVPRLESREESQELDPHQSMIHRDGTISDSDTSEFRVKRTGSGLSGMMRNQESNPTKPANSDSVTVKIKCFIDGKTQDTCIRVKRTTKMKKVEDCLARLMNLDSSESLRFLVDGEQVSPWETLESMKIDDPEQHWFTVMPKVGFQ
jgi:Ubiquitin-2 like Rad60 SUMO-like